MVQSKTPQARCQPPENTDKAGIAARLKLQVRTGLPPEVGAGLRRLAEPPQDPAAAVPTSCGDAYDSTKSESNRTTKVKT